MSCYISEFSRAFNSKYLYRVYLKINDALDSFLGTFRDTCIWMYRIIQNISEEEEGEGNVSQPNKGFKSKFFNFFKVSIWNLKLPHFCGFWANNGLTAANSSRADIAFLQVSDQILPLNDGSTI